MALFISRTALLLLKDLRGELNEQQEQEELNQVITENEELRLFRDELSDDNFLLAEIELMAGCDPAPGLRQLKAAGLIKSRRLHWPKFAAAAIMLLGVAIAIISALEIYNLVSNKSGPQKEEIVENTHKPDTNANPDSTHSYGFLELADKRKIGLGLVADGTIAYEVGTTIRLDKKHVRYEPMPVEAGLASCIIGAQHNTIGVHYNTLVADSGGDFRLTLGDGTFVQLNSGSSIRYPVHFSGTERHVEIVGEVYFEVARNTSKPFIVTAGNVEVEVLGTNFNIKAYPGEPLITTLKTGSVKVSAYAKSKTLSPGQQIEVTESGNLGRIVKANIGQVTAWKDGIFDFKNEKLSVILSELGRWYKLDIDDRRKLQDERRAGIYPRSIPITELLDHLSVPAGIQLKLEGNKIVVY